MSPVMPLSYQVHYWIDSYGWIVFIAFVVIFGAYLFLLKKTGKIKKLILGAVISLVVIILISIITAPFSPPLGNEF